MVVVLGAACLGAAAAKGQLTVSAQDAEVPVTMATASSAYQGPPGAASDSIGDVVIVWSQQSTATAKAVSVNLTVVAPSGNGFVALYPGDAAQPTTSSINFTGRFVLANNGVFGLSRAGDGSLAVYPAVGGTNGQVHLLIDLNGYFQ